MKSLITGAAALALAVSPMAASAQNAASALSVARAGASIEDGNQAFGDSAIVGILVFVVIVGAFFAIAESDGDEPVSA